MPESLSCNHAEEVDVSARPGIILRVDDRLIIRCGVVFSRRGGRDVNRANRERVLEHLHHGSVALVGLRLKKRAVIANVEEKLHLACLSVSRGKALYEDLLPWVSSVGISG